MSGFGAGMGAQNGAFKSLLNDSGPDGGSGPSFGSAGDENKQDLGSVRGSGSPARPSSPRGAPSGRPQPGGLGYQKLLGNLVNMYNVNKGFGGR